MFALLNLSFALCSLLPLFLVSPATPAGGGLPPDLHPDTVQALTIDRGAKTLSVELGRCVLDGCDGIVRLKVAPGRFEAVRCLVLRPWADALEGAEFTGGTETVNLRETGRIGFEIKKQVLYIELPESVRALVDRGGTLQLIDYYR